MPSVLDRFVHDAAGRKLVLHIGGADSALYVRYRSKEWYAVRASFDTAIAPDIDLNTTCLGDLPHASFDAVWCSDMIEHLPRDKAVNVIAASYPLVKAGGEWSLAVPDMETLGGYVAARRGNDPLMQMPDGRKKTALDFISGATQAFTPDSLAQLLMDGGIHHASITARALFLWVGSVIGDQTEGRKIRIRRSAQAATPPALPPLAKQPHPGQFGPRMLSDELDIPAKIISDTNG